jgi:UDP-N-acetylglucosamine 2-epimerase (non-hydrolysing)
MKIVLVAGARPNFMKIAPLMAAIRQHPGLEPLLVHTGQHYDEKMRELKVPPLWDGRAAERIVGILSR